MKCYRTTGNEPGTSFRRVTFLQKKSFLEEKNLPEVIKKKHTYLMMDGHDQEDIYVLKDGVVKVSIVLCDGREFNITYLKGLDI